MEFPDSINKTQPSCGSVSNEKYDSDISATLLKTAESEYIKIEPDINIDTLMKIDTEDEIHKTESGNYSSWLSHIGTNAEPSTSYAYNKGCIEEESKNENERRENINQSLVSKYLNSEVSQSKIYDDQSGFQWRQNSEQYKNRNYVQETEITKKGIANKNSTNLSLQDRLARNEDYDDSEEDSEFSDSDSESSESENSGNKGGRPSISDFQSEYSKLDSTSEEYSSFLSRAQQLYSAYSTLISLKEDVSGTIKSSVESTTESSDDQRYACELCNKTFKSKINRKKHMVVHSGVKSHACSLCDKSFFRRCDLTSHMIAHTGKEKQYPCNLCDRSYSRIRSLNKHLITHHTPGASTTTRSVKNHICQICNKAYSEKNKLKHHLLVHAGIRNHTCSYCGKSFYQKYDLMTHAVMHTKENALSCTLCGKFFPRKYFLERHMLGHYGVKKYVCSICEKSFTNKGSLTKHILIHEGVKNHTCTICDKSFSNKSNLTQHMLIHNDIRKHTCVECGMSFRQKCHLLTHVDRHAKRKAKAEEKLLEQAKNKLNDNTSTESMVSRITESKDFKTDSDSKSFKIENTDSKNSTLEDVNSETSISEDKLRENCILVKAEPLEKLEEIEENLA